MSKTKILFCILICLVLNSSAQINAELLRYSDTTLFNLQDTNCLNIGGEWIGEETQYDPTQSFIKVKFKVVFKLKQEGNRVYGTSYIEDKYRGSYGDMKIRGMVTGNKLHFEEYEIMNEKILQVGVVWCLRSGELTIKTEGNVLMLEGLDYNGYASDSYRRCTDYVKMSVSKPLASLQSRSTFKPVINGNYSGNMKIRIFPNPCVDFTTVSYELKENTKVRIDIFGLSGAYIEGFSYYLDQSETQRTQLNLSSYNPGVYLIRVQAGNLSGTGQVVKTDR